MSLHRLHIETGRWSQPRTTPLNERTLKRYRRRFRM